MPIKPEVTTGDGEVGRDGEFFTGTGADQGAVVADAQTDPADAGVRGAITDLADKGQFSLWVGASGIRSTGFHFLRIGQKTWG